MDSTDPALRIPGRHGADLAHARRTGRAIRSVLRGRVEPDAAEWQAIGESLLRGDAAMDRLVGWMVDEGLSRSKPLFDRLARDGLAAVPDAPPPLREFFAAVETTPAWVDQARLTEGARVSGIAGRTGMDVLRDLGLLAGYQASAINRTLVLTGALEKGAQRRVAETTKWWIDCTRPGGMARGAPGWVGTLQVRLVHALVRRHVARDPAWDAAWYGLPVNQGDMHATYLAFSVIYLLGQRALGVPLTRTEGADLMHLWRYIAWLMGVEDRWLHDSEAAGRRALYHNLLSQAPPDESSRLLGRALKDEPLQRHYANLAWLRGRWNRAKHLSIARTFVGRDGMRALGLPSAVLPWYPLLTVPPRLVWHGLLRALPGGREYLIRRGLAAQRDYLPVLFGGARPEIGAPRTAN